MKTYRVKNMEETINTWIADNSLYKSKHEPFDHYGMDWECLQELLESFKKRPNSYGFFVLALLQSRIDLFIFLIIIFLHM